MCCLTKQKYDEECSSASGNERPNMPHYESEDHPSLEQARWIKPNKTAKMMKFQKPKQQKTQHNKYSVLESETEDNDDAESLCSSMSGNEEFWLREDDQRRETFIARWNKKYGDKNWPNDDEKKDAGFF